MGMFDDFSKQTKNWNSALKITAADTFKIKENLTNSNQALRMMKMQDLSGITSKLLELDFLPNVFKGLTGSITNLFKDIGNAGKKTQVGIFDSKVLGTTAKRLNAIKQTIESIGGDNQISERVLAGLERAKRDTSLQGYAGLHNLGFTSEQVQKMDTSSLYIEALKRAQSKMNSIQSEEAKVSFYKSGGIEDVLGIDFETLRTLNVNDFNNTYNNKLKAQNYNEKDLGNVGRAYTDLTHALENLRLSIYSKLSPLFEKVATKLVEVMPKINDSIDKLLSWVLSYDWGSLLNSVWNTLSEWLPKIWELIKSIGEKAGWLFQSQEKEILKVPSYLKEDAEFLNNYESKSHKSSTDVAKRKDILKDWGKLVEAGEIDKSVVDRLNSGYNRSSIKIELVDRTSSGVKATPVANAAVNATMRVGR